MQFWVRNGVGMGMGLGTGWDWGGDLGALGCIGAAGITFGVCRVHFGKAWDHLVALWVPRACRTDAAGDQVDIAKAYENHWF